MKTVQIRGPGMTEREAIAEAWARLEMQGYIVLDDPPPVVEVDRDDAGRPLGWSVSFPVQETKD
jgi:hypothetical protein